MSWLFAYSTKKFGVFLVMSCILGAVVVGLTVWVGDTVFPIRHVISNMVFQQTVDRTEGGSQQWTGKPTLEPWARITHTLVVLNGTTIESRLAVTALLMLTPVEPPGKNVSIELLLEGDYNDKVAVVIDGNLSWSGMMYACIHHNHTSAYSTVDYDKKVLWTRLTLDNGDGIYFIGGLAAWNPAGTNYGTYIKGEVRLRTRYYLTVEDGNIVKVTDETAKSLEGWFYNRYITRTSVCYPDGTIKTTYSNERRNLNATLLLYPMWAPDNSYVDLRIQNMHARMLHGVEKVMINDVHVSIFATTNNITSTIHLTPHQTTIIRVIGNFLPGVTYQFHILVRDLHLPLVAEIECPNT